jgi:ribulose-bisphosphate carboxylase large chain
VRAASAQTGLPTLYAPSLSGDLDAMRSQLALAREEGVQAALVSPMLCGLPAFHALAREHPEVAFLAHPAMGGAARIAPPLLIGGMFRLFGASAVIFPNHGGRFGYSRETCAAIADAARAPWGPVPAAMPAPAGGMSLDRVGEMLEFYGADTMLLIGGALLAAGDRLTEAAQAFAARARSHDGRSAA